jgi:hypothetical protein
MSTITAKTNRKRLAAIVVAKLKEHDIDAVLVGGSVVSIYTDNKYASNDLDFISAADHKKIKAAMSELGFTSKGKDFIHPETEFTVEFPSGPIGLGDDVPVTAEGSMHVDGVTIKMLSPTQSVMDRLIIFFLYNDRQCLRQAVWIAEGKPIDLAKIGDWVKREKQEEKFQVFLNLLKTR